MSKARKQIVLWIILLAILLAVIVVCCERIYHEHQAQLWATEPGYTFSIPAGKANKHFVFDNDGNVVDIQSKPHATAI